jgi:hypothetical protein
VHVYTDILKRLWLTSNACPSSQSSKWGGRIYQAYKLMFVIAKLSSISRLTPILKLYYDDNHLPSLMYFNVLDTLGKGANCCYFDLLPLAKGNNSGS